MSGLRLPTCALLAVALHGVIAALLADRAAPAHAASPALRQLEITMLAPEPQPEPEPELERQPESQPRTPRPMAAKTRSPQPEPARAGALLTAAPEQSPAQAADEPVRFVTDPQGRGYGTGMVARGGTAEHAPTGATAQGTSKATSHKGDKLAFAERLSQSPALSSHDPCRDDFPEHASAARGEVSVVATVRATGSVARVEVEQELPSDQGFGAAARACLLRQRFEPALDEEGRATAARTRVRLTFTR